MAASRQAAHCVRGAKLASSPEVRAYHQRLGRWWLKLAGKARVAGGHTRALNARMGLRDALGSGPARAVAEQSSEHLPQARPGEAGTNAAPRKRILESACRAGHYVAVTAIVVMIFMVVG